ncbi:MAG: acetyl-CoA carboxylase biotin carboxyl carrier protein subunit [Bacteroidia bacterium]|nr:acetyl-CoA carboxylase biotin carboxyl carrier protein subunit [Bacteroidia bacterium]
MKAIINNKEFIINEKDGEPGSFEVNGRLLKIDYISPAKDTVHLLSGFGSYRVCLVAYDTEQHIATVQVNHCSYEVKLKNESDELMERLGLKVKVHKATQVKAPMPGKVIDIMVKAGDKVSKNDSLLILEAMKMENLIKASADGVVKQVDAGKGMAVEKNQILITMES